MSRSFALAGIALFAAAIPLVAAGLVGAGVDVSRALALASAAAMAVAAPLVVASRLALLPRARTWRWLVIGAGLVALPAIAWLLHAGPVSRITGQPRGWIDVLGVAALGPIAEETLFRGAIWHLALVVSGADDAGRARWIALAMTSVLFGLMHIGYWWLDGASALSGDAIAHASAMVAAGALFGAIRLWSRSLGAPIIVHMLANCTVLFLQTSLRS